MNSAQGGEYESRLTIAQLANIVPAFQGVVLEMEPHPSWQVGAYSG